MHTLKRGLRWIVGWFTVFAAVALVTGGAGCTAVTAKVDEVYANTQAAETGVETAETQHVGAVEAYDAEARAAAAQKMRSDFALGLYADSRPADATAVLRVYDAAEALRTATLADLDRKRADRLTAIYKTILGNLSSANFVIGSVDDGLHKLAALAARIRSAAASRP